jgi:hypothetical protein
MNIKSVIYAVALTTGVAFTVEAIHLEAYVAAPAWSTERRTLTQHTDVGEEAYPIQLPLNALLCPC